jgi:hypothetical protein
MLVGPNTATGHHSVMYTSECANNFTVRISRLVLTGHATSVEIKESVAKKEQDWLEKRLAKLVFTKEEGGIFSHTFSVSSPFV